MELKAGYKKTELGLIPKDWDVVSLGSVGSFKNGINKGSESFGHGSPFVNLMDIFGVSSIKPGAVFDLVQTSDAEQKTYDLRVGDVIFIRSSVKPSGVGLTAVVEAELPKTVFSGFLIRFRDHIGLDLQFKRHCFYLESFRKDLIDASTVSANTNINQENLKKLRIALPKDKIEQRAIATSLSDVDALIAGLEKLIAKKRDLKQAAMQQLLTGQTRLPGFSGKWVVKRLGDLAEMGSGGTPPSANAAYYGGEIPWVAIADMTGGGKYIADTERNLTELGLANSAAQMFPAGTVLYAMYASLGECSIATVPVTTSQAILGIRPKANLSSEFLYYLLTSWKPMVKGLGQQGTQANLNKGIVADFKISMPALEEQESIAAVLIEMDNELAAFEARLAQTRDLKQGMMQELLTGRTRLV